MAKFRHKPTVLTAHRVQQHMELPEPPEKTRRAEPGDWLLVNLAGDIYFVPDDLFRQLYEPADPEAEWLLNSRLIEK